ncbi:Zn-ribbon domain-containing OB-fold protein [Nocardia huaxiensis]|uniref:Zn-ribbon domain-containing OB-fold protein n=1 Tax=Nocardia huaxiensis TaxID=2755382 RepID=UPI001E4D2847|nr:OB-fold domain-containing protein [Nocardia huaxiensis]UFS97693.1 OB-fold domain-containing protein [Nocardia huaxiensis]
MTTQISGPPVVRDERSAEFFDASAAGRLLIRKCADCGHPLGLESRTCACGSSNLEWHNASGSGELISWSVVHHPPHPAFADQVPFPVGLIELAEGPWLNARIVGIDPDRLHAGLSLTVAFVHPAEGDSYPVFAPASSSPKEA